LPADFFRPIDHPAVKASGSLFPVQYQHHSCDSDKAGRVTVLYVIFSMCSRLIPRVTPPSPTSLSNFSDKLSTLSNTRFIIHLNNTDAVSVDKMADDKAVENTQVGNPVQHHEQIRYLATRFSTLKPPMNKAPNPFKLILLLNKRQWAFFFVGFIAWVCL
jgi:hypothetical protein